MFGIGTFELILILIFGFLIFGPDKLPEIAKTVGHAISKFRVTQQEISKVITTEVYDPKSDEPFKNPLDALSKVVGTNTAAEKGENFSERKERYDKYRAAKKKADARQEGLTAKIAEGTEAEKTITDETKAVEVKETKPKPSVDELYGTKPTATKSRTAAKTPSEKTASNVKSDKSEPSSSSQNTTKKENPTTSSDEKKGE